MKTTFFLVVAVALALAAVSCDKDHIALPEAPDSEPLPAPAGVELTPGTEICRVSWSYPDSLRSLVKAFYVYQQFAAYNMIELVGITVETSYVDSFLIGNLHYCYVVSAVDSTDFEGWRSSGVCAFVPSD